MVFVYFIASVLFGALYAAEMLAYRIHNIEWLMLFMFFTVMERFEELRR